jgi:hypothetical protein
MSDRLKWYRKERLIDKSPEAREIVDLALTVMKGACEHLERRDLSPEETRITEQLFWTARMQHRAYTWARYYCPHRRLFGPVYVTR